jgi:predicted amidohydrolase YtcJ
MAEAVTVRNGRILASGNKAAINRYRGKATVDFNLGGCALLPGKGRAGQESLNRT